MIVRDVNNVDEYIKRLDKISNAKFKVGVLGTEDSEILLRAMVNEYGAPSKGIPERPFIRGAFDRYGDDIANFAEKLIYKYIDGKIGYRTCMNLIGDYAKQKVQRYMTDLKSPPNSPNTIKQKGSSNPLIDTAQLLQSISFELVE
jgi:hypothetical protein